jgi:divalent metal cation (Fe/Co/Zn/Cd) transporter
LEKLKIVLVLLSVVAMYTFITLKFSLQEKNISQFLGANEWGYSSLFVMPVAFLCVTLFSESFWQKAWASENKKILRRGALISSLMNFIVIFIFCLFGLFGLLSGRTDANTNEILRVFYIINSEYEPHKTGFVVKSFMGLLLVVSAFIMGTSALDSLQNGIGIFTKLKFSMYITDCVPFLSFCLSLLSTMVYACCVEWKKEVAFRVNLLRGLRKALYGNEYSWKFYAVSFFSSILATALISFINYLRVLSLFLLRFIFYFQLNE